ncbi:hypothetical protein KP509_30G033800 [Ceratopteris richardii]|nr:hypothetical protein KP509_30G033800 [Ceratopteris richardii]
MRDAQHVFSKSLSHRSWSWNFLLIGYIKKGWSQTALDMYKEMGEEDSEHLNVHAFVALLKACAALKDIQTGLRLHVKLSSICMSENNVFIISILMDMYTKCGRLPLARQVFQRSAIQDVVTWTTLIACHVESGANEEALVLFHLMQLEGVSPNAATYVCCLRACCFDGEVNKGQEIHNEVERKGSLSNDVLIGSALVDMYSRFKLLQVAQDVFNGIPYPDVILWTALINGYVENGYGVLALHYFERMQSEGMPPNSATYVCALKACGSIQAADKGQEIHVEIDKQGLLSNNPHVGVALLDMYCKCGLLTKAEAVFNNLDAQDVVPWTALIGGYAVHGYNKKSIDYYEKMRRSGVRPNRVTIVCVLKACTNMQDQDTCHKILVDIEKDGWLEDPAVMISVLDLHMKYGSLDKAQAIFDKLPVRDIVSWTSLISGFVEHGYEEEAIQCMERMQLEGVFPSVITFACILKSQLFKKASKRAFKLHVKIQEQGLEKNPVVGNSLITMYARCGLFSIARKVLSDIPMQTVVSWTTLMAGYIQHGLNEEAVNCYEQMQRKGISPNAVTYVCLLKAYGNMGAIYKAFEVHNEIERLGLLNEDLVGNTLVDICAGGGAFAMAHQVIRNMHECNEYSWNALIAGYIKHGYGKEAMKCFEHMQLEGIIPSATTWLLSMKACSITGAWLMGKQFHAQMVGIGLFETDIRIGGSLINMYGLCGLPSLAQQVFNELPVRDNVSWTSLMAAYAKHGDQKEVYQCLEKIQLESLPLTPFTSVWYLKLCATAKALMKGQDLHHSVIKCGLHLDPYVCSSLINMYNKCGSIIKAQEVFNKSIDRNLISWTSLLNGFTEHSCEEEVHKCYEQMQHEGILPNDVTLLCCIKACGNSGNIEWGNKLHVEVEKKGLLERSFVGNSLVSMYAKCHTLSAARQVFDSLPIQDVVSWNALMTGYVERGEIENIFCLFNEMLESGVQPNGITFLVVLTACAHMGQFQKGETLFQSMNNRYGILPTIEHHTCIIDFLSRTGDIDKGLAMIKLLPGLPDSAVWRSVLGACKFSGCVKNVPQVFSHALNEPLNSHMQRDSSVSYMYQGICV